MNHLLSDTMLIFRRQLGIVLRNPVWVIVGLTQPALYLVLFGPLLTGLAGQAGFPPGDAWHLYTPGLLVQLGLFGASFVGFALIAERRAGVLERLRATPMHRLALLLGRLLRDAIVVAVQGCVLVAVAVAFGLRAPLVDIAVELGFVVVIVIGLAAVSYALALILSNEDGFAQLINTVTVPTLLLSGILLPMSLAPRWLDFLSRLNPMRYVVDAMRDVFAGNPFSGSLIAGGVVLLCLSVASVGFAARVFSREEM